ncbi:hypothetical protein M413DRAFT_257585 [Hebeloma cylindrosporum]|uniref:Uncharacterized protein n=1 Tax=Hebeloma cylindrosporum TaxID=76867 RepID=A0A0C3C1I7_HEBCY|nr:hypothetical protein M413DRAFT_257585 [Hebeloma cylindrosporum h7]
MDVDIGWCASHRFRHQFHRTIQAVPPTSLIVPQTLASTLLKLHPTVSTFVFVGVVKLVIIVGRADDLTKLLKNRRSRQVLLR